MAVLSTGKYESDSGAIHKISLSPDRLAAAGTQPTGNVSTDIRAQISKSNREFGIRPRYVTLSRTIGTGTNAYKRYTTLPVLTPTEFASAAFQLEATITIGGIEWTIIARSREDY